MDALCRTCSYQCTAYGSVSQHKAMGIFAYRCIYDWICAAFLAVGLFTTKLLEFFKAHVKVVRYTAKIGGVLMIFMGILMFTGKMNAVTGYLSSGAPVTVEEQKENEETADAEEKQETESGLTPAIDFILTDQYGNTHKLSDYKGKRSF